MLHTLFSDVPVEQQETVAGGDKTSCSCSISPEESKKLDEILRSYIYFPFPFPHVLN